MITTALLILIVVLGFSGGGALLAAPAIRARHRRATEILALARRADQQNALYLAGDPVGMYGDYLPDETVEPLPKLPPEPEPENPVVRAFSSSALPGQVLSTGKPIITTERPLTPTQAATLKLAYQGLASVNEVRTMDEQIQSARPSGPLWCSPETTRALQRTGVFVPHDCASLPCHLGPEDQGRVFQVGKYRYRWEGDAYEVLNPPATVLETWGGQVVAVLQDKWSDPFNYEEVG